jgi:hypothetical protein
VAPVGLAVAPVDAVGDAADVEPLPHAAATIAAPAAPSQVSIRRRVTTDVVRSFGRCIVSILSFGPHSVVVPPEREL